MHHHSTTRALYVLLILSFALVGISSAPRASASSGTLDFGNTADNTTATTSNTGFGGVRIGNGGGSFTIKNPGQEIGTQAELQGIAPTAGSINSVGVTSAEYGTAATVFTVSFEVYLSGGSSGTWYFFAGNGTSFGSAQSSGFTGAEVFTGLRFAYGASNTITTNNRNGSTWNTTGITGTPFAQNTPYTVSIIGNNSASTVDYGSGTVAANKYDLWVNGTLVGDDLAKASLAAATNINAFRFYGESSTGNVATINLDNIRWWNQAVPPSMSTYSTVSSVPARTYSVLNMNSGSASLAGNVTVNELLSLNTGNLTLGTSTLTLGTSATVGGAPSATSMVITNSTGKLCKSLGGTGGFMYPIGDSTDTAEYSPVTLDFTSGTFASAQACVSVSDAKHPNNSGTTHYLTRYWTVSQSGISDYSCGTTFSYVDADIIGTESNLYTGQWNGSAWTQLNAANTANNTIGGTVSSFGDFTGAELGIFTTDTAPSVTGTDPANDATAATNANIVVTFSENVVLDSGWYGISCASSGSHTAAQSGGPLTFTLVPSPVFTAGETCTVTVYAAKVHDQDTNDPPDTMTANKVWSFTVDAAPYVLSTYPASGATGVPRSANLTATFSEAVNVTTGWFAISCGTSGSHTATITGGPTTFTLNPNADFTAGESCTVTVYGANVTDQDAYDPPDVMAGNYTWTFSVSSAADCAPDLFFSEYVEGSSDNKAVEIINATTGSVNLAGYEVQIYFNGNSTAGPTITLVGTLAQGGVYLLCNSNASFAGQCNQTSGSLTFNGNDAVVLRHSSSIIDAIGQVGTDPGTAWTWGSLATVDMTLRRKATVTSGDSVASDGFLAGLAAQWEGYAKDTFDGLGSHSCSCAEVAPYVIGTLPDTNGTRAAVGANLTVTFQEPVSASASSFSLQCDKSGAHALTVSGGSTSFTLDPTADFQSCETCTLTVLKDYVTDLDTNDPPNTMADNYAFSFTTACACSTIYGIQGSGSSSACEGETIASLSGCVTGVTATGFYMQDTAGDGNSATSDGIYVYMYSTWPNIEEIAAGYTATATGGAVQEYYNATELYHPSGAAKGAACTLPTPVAVEQIQTMAAANVDQYEAVEFMRVSMDIDGYVQGPTKRFVSRFTNGDPEIGFIKWGNESSVTTPPRLFEEDYAGYGGLNYLSGACNKNLPDVDFGDRIQGTEITGVMGYHFDKWQLIVDEIPNQSLTVTNNPDVTDDEVPLSPDQWSVCTYNLENMFDAIDDSDGDIGDWQPPDAATYQRMLLKRALGMAVDLERCSVIGVQEMEGKDQVWNDLEAAMEAAAPGSNFEWDYYESQDVRDITVGIFYDTSRVRLNSSTQRQGCTATDYSVDYTKAQGSRVIANPCTGATYPLYDRPPYVANLTVSGVPGGPTFTMIVNHFKSMSDGATETRPRREAQATHNVALAYEYSQATPYLAIVGDLNDYIGSTPIAILNAGKTYDNQALVNVHTAPISPRPTSTPITSPGNRRCWIMSISRRPGTAHTSRKPARCTSTPTSPMWGRWQATTAVEAPARLGPPARWMQRAGTPRTTIPSSSGSASTPPRSP